GGGGWLAWVWRGGWRDRFRTGPGRDSGGSKLGQDGWTHTPEKSGMDAGAGAAAVCPEAGAVAMAANVANTMRCRRCALMQSSSSRLPSAEGACRVVSTLRFAAPSTVRHPHRAPARRVLFELGSHKFDGARLSAGEHD